MAEKIPATWRDLRDLEVFRRDFERLMEIEPGSDRREEMRAKLARQWGLLYQPVYSVRGSRGIVFAGTTATQDVVDTAINDPDHMFYAEAVRAARTQLDLALGAMERALREDGPRMPGVVKPVYQAAAKRPVRAFVVAAFAFAVGLAGIGQFVLALLDRLKV